MAWKIGPIYIDVDELTETEEVGADQNIYVDKDKDGKIMGIEIAGRYRISRETGTFRTAGRGNRPPRTTSECCPLLAQEP